MRHPLLGPALAGVLLQGAPATGAHAAEPEGVTTLPVVQVTATRAPRATDEVPAAITVVAGEDLATDTLGIAVSEKLAAVPGVLARQRQNHAQDEQVSIRGFGTRASFGIRGVRLYVDGIPATMPDGQGQLSHFPLATAERIEILRGPFSALYGNASGGVVQLFTATGTTPSETGVALAHGADAAWRASVDARGTHGPLGYALGLTRFSTEGYRDHSRAERTLANAQATFAAGAATRLRLLASGLDAPDAQDPQGLTRAQFDADPRQASAGALLFDTRKSTRQRQLGAVLEHDAAGAQWRLLAYAGQRTVEQVLSIPVATQANPLHGGGVIDLRAPYTGADARWTHAGTLAGRPLELVAGLAWDAQHQDRHGYENFAGERLGVRGALRLDQDDRVASFDQYAQATWRAAPEWLLLAGVRRSEVRFRSRDHYVTAANPDDSGRVAHRATSPVAGVTWHAAPALHVYAAWGRGFETPTFNELGYRADGGSGPNFALQPARTRSVEVGAKLARGALRSEVALFRADTRDELTVDTSLGGRSTFRNAGRARRTGVEWSATLPLGDRWRAQVALTWLDARFRDAFLACVTTPCATPQVPVAAGTRIPGVPRTAAYLALHWGEARGWHARLEGQHVGAVTLNNAGDERAAGYAVFGASAGHGLRSRHGDGRWFVAVGNVFDRTYAGSVIVNDSNRRYYEPAPGRTATAGLEWRWRH